MLHIQTATGQTVTASMDQAVELVALPTSTEVIAMATATTATAAELDHSPTAACIDTPVGKPEATAERLRAIQDPQGKSRGRCGCRYPSPDKSLTSPVSNGGVF